MTDFQFLEQLKTRLQSYQQILISADGKQIEAATVEMYQFIRQSQAKKLEPSGKDLSGLSKAIKELYELNTKMITEGLNFYQSLIVNLLEGSSSHSYSNPSQTNKSNAAQRRSMFDASI